MFPPGTKVKYAGTFLDALGKRAGAAAGKTYFVVPCDCELCRQGTHVCLSAPSPFARHRYSSQELDAHPDLAWLHAAIGVLVRVPPASRPPADRPA
jgi:hypothetical protein